MGTTKSAIKIRRSVAVPPNSTNYSCNDAIVLGWRKARATVQKEV